MRRSADARSKETQRVQMLRQQMLARQRANAGRPTLAALIAASHAKSSKRHIDGHALQAHDQASRDARRVLRELESMGPAQILCEVLSEAADEIIESALEMAVDDCMEPVAEMDLADDFSHSVHLN